MCSSYSSVSIFTEHIPTRLADIPGRIAFPEILHAYDQALRGYHELAKRWGCFIVDGGMMGVSQA